jgi:tripeptide aminopeptidase
MENIPNGLLIFAYKILSMQHIIDRFISYVTIDTESDPNSTTTPSTAKQWNLANKLAQELKEIGLTDVTIDEKSYLR